jgi:hypothetical protein
VAVLIRRAALAGVGLFALASFATGCATDTSRLTPEQAKRFETEGILHQAENVVFRQTHDVGRADAGWRDVVASVVVTKQSVVIHRNERILLEINPRSRRFLQVRRDGSRVRIRSGGGGAAEVWSFQPPDDPSAWAKDIRATIAAARG